MSKKFVSEKMIFLNIFGLFQKLRFKINEGSEVMRKTWNNLYGRRVDDDKTDKHFLNKRRIVL